MHLLRKIQNKIFQLRLRHSKDEKKNKLLRRICAHVGENARICGHEFGAEPYLIWIGNNVVTAIGTSFIEHDVSYYTAMRYLKRQPIREEVKMGGIILRDNCFIGANSILLGGADVGENSIIAAGSVCNGRIPPNEVWGGVPAHFIMTIDEYARKVVTYAEDLPWIKDGRYREMGEQELIAARQRHYLQTAPTTEKSGRTP